MPSESVTSKRLRQDPPHKTVAQRLAALSNKSPRNRARTLPPIHPSSLIEANYRRKIEKLIDEMERSLMWWLPAAYKANEPRVAELMAADEAPATALGAIVRRLARYWQRRFDRASQDLAKYFAEAVAQRSDHVLRRALREGGMSVRFTTTRAINDALRASINENVSLIRSIPSQHFTQIEGQVMRSVQTGRDLKQLTDDLQNQFEVTRRRAAFIARDQNNKASSTVHRVRSVELGITQAIWVHSAGGKEPRPSHVKAGRERTIFDLREGWLDPAINKRIWPGTEINCRCVARPVIPGFS